MKRIIYFLLLPLLFLGTPLFAQDGNDPLSYSNMALQFNNPLLNGDAASANFPSVALSNGFGSYLDNPASIALLKESAFSLSILNNNVEQENSYLNNTLNSERNNTQLSNLGFVYKLPTEQGSFVAGGGYNLHSNNLRSTNLSAFNTQSTITDYFKDPGSDYYDTAFNTYAIDYATTDSTYLESIFRIGIDYPGITQDAKITQTTNIGEYSAFFGTEFQKDLYLGLSIGLTSGNYTYRRDFLELDDQNFYDGDFIEGSDISDILTHDEIDADILAFSIRAGAIYSINNINVGISYLLPSTMNVVESYYSSIETYLDDGSEPFFSDFSGDFSYSIRQPGKLNAGVAVENLNGFSLTAAAEYVDYSKTELDLINENEILSYNDERILREEQTALNDEMAADYKQVLNLRAGLKYEVPNRFEIKAAYAYLPGRSENFSADKNIISGGLGIHLTEQIILDLSSQYAIWDDESVAYSYFDNSDQFRQESISQSVKNLSFMAGVRILF